MRTKDSKLVTSTTWCNNYWKRPPYKADIIFIHHACAVKVTGKAIGQYFQRAKVASNYQVGHYGDINQAVEEKYGAYCQGSQKWNKRGYSIEVVNSTGSPTWKVSNEALESTIELVADILIRNDMGRARYTGDLSGNIGKHKWVASTSCPGPYLDKKFVLIQDEANKIIDGEVRVPLRGYFIKGDYGRSVRLLQRWLRKQGFYNGPYKGEFGRYGSQTIRAVKKFQKKYGLTEDGEWGKECMKKYKELSK